MDNPWKNLPREQPFVLEGDKLRVFLFNDKVEDRYKIHLELLPEPYLGNPNAEVLLLSLNPGFSTDDAKFHHSNDYFKTSSRINLLHGEQEYPFFFLDPQIVKVRGRRWWDRKLSPLVDIFGAAKVASHVCCVEFFPYHSAKYKSIGPPLPSQEYSFSLVRKGIERNALIVLMRSTEKWLRAVPELASYRFYEVNSPRNAIVSRNNLPEGFERIIESLQRVALPKESPTWLNCRV